MSRSFCKIAGAVLFAAGLLSCSVPARAQAPSAVSPQGYVTDNANVLGPSDEARIAALAKELENKTGDQLAVLTVPSTKPLTIEQYAVRLFEEWGIGQKGEDNGILLLAAVQDRKVRVEVGYGLEGVMTDALSKRVIERIMVPAFRRGEMSAGIYGGASAVASIIAEARQVTLTGASEQVYQQVAREEKPVHPVLRFLIILFAFLFIFGTRSGLLTYFLFGSMVGGRQGYWSGGSAGGLGGGFGGGFGGFGGGLSGGGGASGGW
ncbi:MAG: TPM domain-containing protein [Candidatus Omnitrophota bacterium]